jgi:rhamnogalacturonan endolyase
VTASGPATAPVNFIAIGNDLDQGPIPAICSPASGSEFAVGTTTVTCTVTDIVGATVGASFTVTVKAANTAAFLVRHAPVVNGGTTVTGSMRVMLPENVTFNGGTMTGDLLIPGTPQLTRNGQTTLGGTVDGTGAAAPTTHRITLNGGTSLSRIVRRTDGFVLNTVASPASPAGTRSVSLNNTSDQIGSWATLRDLTLNGNIGSVNVQGGTYGNFTANGSNKLVLGVAGSTTPTVYNFQSLVLNGSSSIEVVGPVVVTVKNALSLNGSVNATNNPEWLTLKVATGGVTLNGNIAVRGFIEAPTGTVTINGNSSITGRVIADGLTLNGSAKLTLVQ